MSHQQLLTQQYLNNTLPHAILINGAKGSGKLELASWLVNVLLCKTLQKSVVQKSNQDASTSLLTSEQVNACGICKTCLLAKNHSYPDHLTLDLTGASIGIDEVRRANTFLEKKAHIGKFKSILIPDAQTMTVAAANALLKTLEEPSPDSIIILLTHDLDLLLPTIISRCRLLTIRGQVGEALITQFKQNGVDSNNTALNAFVNLSHLPELQDQHVNAAYQLFESSYLHYLSCAKAKDQSNENNDIFLKLLHEQTYALRWLEKITANLLRTQFLPSPLKQSKKDGGFSINSIKLNSQTLHHLYKAIIEASKVLKLLPQANDKFILEKLHLSLYDIVSVRE